MVLGNVGNGVCEEQGKSTQGLTNMADQRGKEKVIEISDEEEDSNRVCIEQQAVLTPNSIHSLDECNADDRHATTSGIEIGNVCFQSGFGSGTLKHVPFEDYKMGIGTVERISPHQPGRPISVKKHSRTYHQIQKMQLARAISGDDSGEVICGPVASTNDFRSIGERGSLEHHQGEKGRLRAGMKTSETFLRVGSLSATFDRSSHNAVTISAIKLNVLSLQFSYVDQGKVVLCAGQSCPVCGKTFPMGISNAELNSHIDQCLATHK